MTSAAWSSTVTPIGELTGCGFAGNGWPGSTPGRVGPSPVTIATRTSPALAGVAAVTGEKSRGVYISSVGASVKQRLIDADGAAIYSLGHLLFVRQGTLFAQKLNSSRMQFEGKPLLVSERVPVDGVNLGAFSASDTGSIAYRTGTVEDQSQFVWFDRTGKEIQKLGPPVVFPGFGELSPDGRRVVLHRTVKGNNNIWLLDARGLLTPFTSDPSAENFPIWAPDGRKIAFNSNRTGVFDLYQKRVDGSGTMDLLLATPFVKSPTDWSFDGRFVLYRSTDPKSGKDIWALDLSNKKTFPVVQTSFVEKNGQFSPDGKWIAYESNESGRFEIYIQPFPGPGEKSQISLNGGIHVRWRGDGKELFYIGLDGGLMAVSVRIDPKTQVIEAGPPELLFRPRLPGNLLQDNSRPQYMVSRDGQRFLVNIVPETSSASPINIIFNWKPKQ